MSTDTMLCGHIFVAQMSEKRRRVAILYSKPEAMPERVAAFRGSLAERLCLLFERQESAASLDECIAGVLLGATQ